LGALALNPEMSLDELRAMFEHWGDVTAEPGGVDYIGTDAGGVPALWAAPERMRPGPRAALLARRGLRDPIARHQVSRQAFSSTEPRGCFWGMGVARWVWYGLPLGGEVLT